MSVFKMKDFFFFWTCSINYELPVRLLCKCLHGLKIYVI